MAWRCLPPPIIEGFANARPTPFIMPIYAYKCASCGYAKDVLQKISDAPLTVCPSCNAEAFAKQVTAAGFQLKGSGWYATDFRNGQTPAKPAGDKAGADAKPAEGAPAAKTDSATAAPAAAPAPAPAAATPPASSSPKE
jgi:putative FmdB family regulatory protein